MNILAVALVATGIIAAIVAAFAIGKWSQKEAARKDAAQEELWQMQDEIAALKKQIHDIENTKPGRAAMIAQAQEMTALELSEIQHAASILLELLGGACSEAENILNGSRRAHQVTTASRSGTYPQGRPNGGRGVRYTNIENATPETIQASRD